MARVNAHIEYTVTMDLSDDKRDILFGRDGELSSEIDEEVMHYAESMIVASVVVSRNPKKPEPELANATAVESRFWFSIVPAEESDG